MNQPIFIFGMPRSGTTWIGKVFDSHPQTLYKHEADRDYPTEIPLFVADVESETIRESCREYVLGISKLPSPTANSKLPFFRKSYANIFSYCGFYARILLGKGIDSQINKSLGQYLLNTKRTFPDARLVWKSVQSLGRLGAFIHSNDGIGLHIVRHPCGHIESVLRGESARKFTAKVPSSEDFGVLKMLLETESAKNHKLSLTKFQNMSTVERLAWRWVLSNDFAVNQASRLSRYKIIYYDAVCRNPAQSFKGLFDFCNLDWHKQTANFIYRSTSKQQYGYYSVYRNATESADKWQQEFAWDSVQKILNITRLSRTSELLGIGNSPVFGMETTTQQSPMEFGVI